MFAEFASSADLFTGEAKDRFEVGIKGLFRGTFGVAVFGTSNGTINGGIKGRIRLVVRGCARNGEGGHKKKSG